MAPQVVVVNIGPKNPHFDENIYPHLKFFYTPDLKAVLTDKKEMNQHFKVEGEPEFLKKALNLNKINEYGFLLFDKNGVCYTEGGDILGNYEIASVDCSNGKTLGENVKNLVKKGKTTKVSNKPLNWKKEKVPLKINLKSNALTKKEFLTGHELPSFNVETKEGEQVDLSEWIKGKPTLMIFMYIPPDENVEAVYKQYKGDRSGISKAATTKMTKNILYLSMLEGQIFNFNPKKALKEKYSK
jgi:hypothetical protein